MASDADERLATGDNEGERGDQDLGDLLQELRVLLPGVQTLTAFLIILPFQSGFAEIRQDEKWSYTVMFVCAIVSLVLFAAPAAYHRLVRPLRDREQFKHDATRLIVIGMIPLTLALVLAVHLVVTRVAGTAVGLIVAAVVAVLIIGVWWVFPLLDRRRAVISDRSRR
ncbi:MAG TPA: DUF6328 family protein [Thermomicrobiales bacterium]|jgi:O-antigen/teichoic acid export membrane protein|nr:DUF6328 family protein [Thermomicrobiales bacterium]